MKEFEINCKYFKYVIIIFNYYHFRLDDFIIFFFSGYDSFFFYLFHLTALRGFNNVENNLPETERKEIKLFLIFNKFYKSNFSKFLV